MIYKTEKKIYTRKSRKEYGLCHFLRFGGNKKKKKRVNIY